MVHPAVAHSTSGSSRLSSARAAASLAAQGAEIILAGGLNGEATTAVGRPFGIDICRAVEAAPGRKDPGRVRRFFQEVIR